MMQAIQKIGPFLTEGLEKAGTFFKGMTQPFKNNVSTFTTGIKKTFKILIDKLPKFIKNSFSYAQKAGRYGSQVASRMRQIGNTSSPLLGKSNAKLNRLISRANTQAVGLGTGSSGIMSLQGALKIRNLHGDEAARMYQGLIVGDG